LLVDGIRGGSEAATAPELQEARDRPAGADRPIAAEMVKSAAIELAAGIFLQVRVVTG
jgi:hypothetical protein